MIARLHDCMIARYNLTYVHIRISVQFYEKRVPEDGMQQSGFSGDS